jgi:hypothetical protein
MKKVDLDWRFLADALLAVLACGLVGALMVWYSLHFKQNYQKAFQSSQAQFRQTSERYLSVDDEARIIRDKYPRFMDLYDRGVLGKENRLNWLETLRAAGTSIKMPNLRYQVSSQESVTPPYLSKVSAGSFKVYTSKMQLDLGLLHEYDLAALLDDLNKNAAGLYSVSQCTMSRANPEIKMDPKVENIKATCALDWYTVNLPGEGLVLKQ